jgi:hypothetical protein
MSARMPDRADRLSPTLLRLPFEAERRASRNCVVVSELPPRVVKLLEMVPELLDTPLSKVWRICDKLLRVVLLALDDWLLAMFTVEDTAFRLLVMLLRRLLAVPSAVCTMPMHVDTKLPMPLVAVLRSLKALVRVVPKSCEGSLLLETPAS